MSPSLLLPPLLRLPVELHREITKNLDLRERAILSLTSRYFASLIGLPSFKEFLAAERHAWAISKELYACRGCKRLRRLRQFADELRKGKRGRGGIEADSRFCVECGLSHDWYQADMIFTILGETYMVRNLCKTCRGRVEKKRACNTCSFTLQAIWTGSKYLDRDAHHYESYDDWEHTTNAYAIGRHADEMYGVWPDG